MQNKLNHLLKEGTDIFYIDYDNVKHNIRTTTNIDRKLKNNLSVKFINDMTGLNNTVTYKKQKKKYYVVNKFDSYILDNIENVISLLYC